MIGYASGTSVSAEKSRGEIEQLVQKYAGRDADFTYGKTAGQAAIAFVAKGRRVLFAIPLPTREEADEGSRDGRAPSRKPSETRVEQWLEKETRRRWRCLLLIVKAKFAAVDIWEELGNVDMARTAFDREFLAHIETPRGTIFDVIASTVGAGRLLGPAEERDE